MLFKSGLAALLLFLALSASAVAETAVSSAGEYPAVAVTGQGEFVLVWQEAVSTGNKLSLFARLFEAGGKPKGPAFVVTDEVAIGQQQTVAAGPGGRFVVAWTGGDGNFTGIVAQRFNRDGKRLGGRIQVNTETEGWQDSPAVAMDRDGSFVVAWRDSPLHPTGIKAQRFSAAGAREGAELAMDLQKAPYSGPFVAVDPEGFSVGWTEQTPPQDRHDHRDTVPAVARFTPEGQPAAAPDFRLSDGVDDGNGWKLVGLDSSAAGTVALLDGSRNSFQLLSPGGDPKGPRTVVGKRAPCLNNEWCEKVLATAMDSSGRFAIVWLVSRIEGTGAAVTRRNDLLAQLFDAAGRPLGERFQVNRDYDARFSDAVAALSDDGVLTVAWHGQRPNNPSREGLVFRQIRKVTP